MPNQKIKELEGYTIWLDTDEGKFWTHLVKDSHNRTVAGKLTDLEARIRRHVRDMTTEGPPLLAICLQAPMSMRTLLHRHGGPFLVYVQGIKRYARRRGWEQVMYLCGVSEDQARTDPFEVQPGYLMRYDEALLTALQDAHDDYERAKARKEECERQAKENPMTESFFNAWRAENRPDPKPEKVPPVEVNPILAGKIPRMGKLG